MTHSHLRLLAASVCWIAAVVCGCAGPVLRLGPPQECTGPKPDASEYAIYQYLLNKVFLDEHIVINRRTDPVPVWRFEMAEASADAEQPDRSDSALADFFRKNEVIGCIDRLPAFVTEGRSQKGGEVEITFSRIGFNSARTDATVATSVYRGRRMVQLRLFWLKIVDGKIEENGRDEILP